MVSGRVSTSFPYRRVTVPESRSFPATSGLTRPLRSKRPSANTFANDPLNKM